MIDGGSGLTRTGHDEPDGLIAAAALFLVGSGPQAWRGMLDQHVPDRTGHCAGCRSQTHGSPLWPCTLRAIAESARDIAAVAGQR